MEITWYVEDGYTGGSRPQRLSIDEDDLADYETKEEFEDFINDCIQEDFQNKVSYHFKMPEFKKIIREDD